MVLIISTAILSFLIGLSTNKIKNKYKKTSKQIKRKPIEQNDERAWAAELSQTDQNAIPLNLLK